jgi:hypothetical protein
VSVAIGTMVKKYVDIGTTIAYGIVFDKESVIGLDPYVRVYWFKVVGPRRLREPPYTQVEFYGMLEEVSPPS